MAGSGEDVFFFHYGAAPGKERQARVAAAAAAASGERKSVARLLFCVAPAVLLAIVLQGGSRLGGRGASVKRPKGAAVAAARRGA